MPETNNTQAITTSTATTDASSTTPTPVDELTAAHTRITELEERLAWQRDQERRRPMPELISPLIDLWRATQDTRYLDAARAQGDVLLEAIAARE